jgi:hypothetical protein
MLFEQRHRLLAIGGFGDYGHIGLCIQDGGQAVAHHGVIIG